jgi:CheY-like chemotaxis protein
VGERLHVLVIEDNQDAAESLQLLLTLLGHDVQVAFDGRAGVAAAAASRPDVLVSDLGLPGELDGFAVARAMRADPTLSPTYLIALSGYGQDDDRRQAQQAGFDLHLIKPVDPAVLARTLAAVPRRG